MKDKKLKILVFDDNAKHRKAAEMLLKEHEVTVVGSYDEAEKALSTHLDEAMHMAIMSELGFSEKPCRDASDEVRHAYWQAWGKAEKRATVHPDFDVVMTDLLVPASRKTQGDKGMRFVGQEMPIGSIIALLALSRGIKLVTVVTDTGHHDHPASAAFDAFKGVSVIGSDIRILCVGGYDSLMTVDQNTFEEVSDKFLSTDDGKKKYPQLPNYTHEGLISVKAWNHILAKLIGEVKDEE